MPTALFFAAFFLVFSAAELLFVLGLKYAARRHATFVIDKLMSFRFHHRHWLEPLMGLFGVAVAVTVFTGADTISIIIAGTPALRAFAVTLIPVMALIGFFTLSQAKITIFEKRLHLYVYLLFSVFLYAGLVGLAERHTLAYQNYVRSRLVEPAGRELESAVQARRNQALLSALRADLVAGKCPEADLEAKTGEGARNFILLEGPREFPDPLKGRLCTQGAESILFTQEGGAWRVVDQN